MISEEVLDSFEPDMRKALESAVILLHSSGALQMQLESNYQSLIHGDMDEPADSLAQRILDHRKRQAGIESLSELAVRLKEQRQ